MAKVKTSEELEAEADALKARAAEVRKAARAAKARERRKAIKEAREAEAREEAAFGATVARAARDAGMTWDEADVAAHIIAWASTCGWKRKDAEGREYTDTVLACARRGDLGK